MLILIIPRKSHWQIKCVFYSYILKNVSFNLDLIEATWLNILWYRRIRWNFRTLQFKKNRLFPWLWLLKENYEHFEHRVEYPVSWSASRVIWCVFGFPPLSLCTRWWPKLARLTCSLDPSNWSPFHSGVNQNIAYLRHLLELDQTKNLFNINFMSL